MLILVLIFIHHKTFVFLKYFETAHVLIMKVFSCVSQFVSAQGLKHELNSSYINVKVYASVLVSAPGLLFRHID